MNFRGEYEKLQHQLFMVREARFRGASRWSRDYWQLTELKLIKQFNSKQGVEYAKLVL